MNKNKKVVVSRRNLMRAVGITATTLIFNLSLKNVSSASSVVTEEETLRAISQIQGLSTFSVLLSKLQAHGLSLDMQNCFFQKHDENPNIWGLGFLANESIKHPKRVGFVSVTGNFLDNNVLGINYDVRHGRFQRINSLVGKLDVATGQVSEQESRFVIDLPRDARGGSNQSVTELGTSAGSFSSLAPSRLDKLVYEPSEQIEQRTFTFPDGTTETVDVEIQRAETRPADRATSANCWNEHQGPYFLGIGPWKLVWCGTRCGFIGGADSIWQNWIRKCCNPGGCGIWNGYTTRMSFNSSACVPICGIR